MVNSQGPHRWSVPVGGRRGRGECLAKPKWLRPGFEPATSGSRSRRGTDSAAADPVKYRNVTGLVI